MSLALYIILCSCLCLYGCMTYFNHSLMLTLPDHPVPSIYHLPSTIYYQSIVTQYNTIQNTDQAIVSSRNLTISIDKT